MNKDEWSPYENEDKIEDICDWLLKYSQRSHLMAGEYISKLSHSKTEREARQNPPRDSFWQVSGAGFVFRSINWEMQSLSSSEATGTCNFLSDWEEFWNYLTIEESDEIAKQLPFFRAAMTVVFHRRIMQLMYIMFIWNIVLLTIIQSQFSKHQKGFVGGNFISMTFELVVYLLVCLMIKGPEYIQPCGVFFRPKPAIQSNAANEQEGIESREIAQEAIDQKFSLFISFKRLLSRGKVEMALFLGRRNQSNNNIHSPISYHTVSSQHSSRSLYYYSWINMALKVLIRDYGIDVVQINFDRRSYRIMTFFAIFLFPIYATVADYVGIITAVNSACDNTSEVEASHSCSFYSYQFIFSVFGLTFVLNHIFYGAAIIIALVGLAYGGEIAFRLAECWVQKYHSLRRLKINDLRKETDYSSQEKAGDKPLIQTRKPSSVTKVAVNGSWKLPQDLHKFQCIVRRDAIEHYLFISALLNKAGEMWSPVLLLFVFLVVFICLSDVLVLYELFQLPTTLATTVVIVRMICFVLVRGLVLIVYPILSIAFANAYFLKMYDIFRIADETDYELIGGRNRWLNIFKESPATWTFFGVAITPERLAALLWTGLVALGGIFLSTLINNSNT